MDIRAVGVMTASDLRQRVRDRSVLVFGLAVPFALMVVFNFLFAGVSGTDGLDPVTVAMSGVSDPTGAQLAEVLGELEVLDVTVTEAAPAAARRAVEDGDADLAVVVPEDFQEGLRTGGSPSVEVVDDGDGSIEAAIVTSVVDDAVARVASGSRAAAAAAGAGIDPGRVGEIAQSVAAAPDLVTTSPGEVADEQLSLQGSLVAGQTALFMFFTVGFGVIAYLAERDQGTLPRLQSMPLHPRSIIVAKTLVSFVLGLAATTVLLGAGGLLFGVSFGSPVAVAVLVVATVAAATSLVLVVTRVVRTAEQASTVNSILALALGVLGGSFFPIGGGGWLSTLSDLTPPAAFIRGLGITQAGGGVADLGSPLATVLGFLVLSVLLAVVLPNREVEA